LPSLTFVQPTPPKTHGVHLPYPVRRLGDRERQAPPRGAKIEEDTMKYLMFVCVDDELVNPESVKNMGPDTMAWVEEMDGRGVRVQGNALGELATATTVRVRTGEVVLADGPFAETKEHIAGFDILECADLDEAIEVASKHPVAKIGAMEVRPFRED
jgi:hypothetical protein